MASDELNVLLAAAKGGDTHAFTLLTKSIMPSLRSLTYRMAGNPQDAEDLQQESLLRAFTQLEHFRAESSFKTWILGIATHVCLDYLRSKRRWRAHAQVFAQEVCRASEPLRAELMATMSSPEFTFDAQEHIAFCFSCVGRSLPPEQQAALLLREVLSMSNREAAQILGVSESVLRHHLAAGRKSMEEDFEGLCVLVSKHGVCYQCAELRELTPPAQRGPAVATMGSEADPPNDRFRRRLAIVRDAPLEAGVSRTLHDLLFRRISTAEQSHVEKPG